MEEKGVRKMKLIDPFDLKQLARVGIAKYDPRKMEWKFNEILWHKIFRQDLKLKRKST